MEEIYGLLFEHLFAGFAYHKIILDEDGIPVDFRFLQVNPAFEELTGLDRNIIVGRTVREILPGVEDSWIDRYGKVALTGCSDTFTGWSGVLGRHYKVFAFSIEIGYFATFFIDVSVEVELEKNLRLLQRRQAQFVQNVSHELRTPIGLIMGYAEMMQFGAFDDMPDKQTQAIDVIVKRARSLARFVDALLVILELDHDDEIVKARIDLVELVGTVARDHRMFAMAKRLALDFVSPERLCIMADGDMIRQAVDNLIRNAIKFTDVGKIVVSVMVQEAFAVIAVQDTGIGIPADEIENIFERFYQVNGGTSRRFEGTGLGLAVVQEIVQAHGGKIEVDSELGKGSLFRIFIPMEGG